MELEESVSTEAFQHQPLDHNQPSIRLVTVQHGLSPEGLIRCKVTHGTVESDYACLSYRWGPPMPSQEILINDKIFLVRKNLFDFLDMVREQRTVPLPYWVDALCIDQKNMIERNHQVAHMGDIYSRALTVEVWLGNITDPAYAPRIGAPGAHTDLQGGLRTRRVTFYEQISNDEYWSRAWIVQEILLAHKVRVWLNRVRFNLDTLYSTLNQFHASWTTNPIGQFRLFTTLNPSSKSQAITDTKALYQGVSLVMLLAHFQDKRCQIPRDRIFSLLSICRGDHGIEVDYRCSDANLSLRVMEQYTDSICVCTPLLAARCLEWDLNNTKTQALEGSNGPIIEMQVDGLCFDDCFAHNDIHSREFEHRNKVNRLQVFALDNRYYQARELEFCRLVEEKEIRHLGKYSTNCGILESFRAYLQRVRQVVEISKERFEHRGNRKFRGVIVSPNLVEIQSLQNRQVLWIERLQDYGKYSSKLRNWGGAWTPTQDLSVSQKGGETTVMQTRLKTVMEFLNEQTAFWGQLPSKDSKKSSSCDQLGIMTNAKTWTRGQFRTRVLEGGLLRPDSVLLPEVSYVHITDESYYEMYLRNLIQSPGY